jgi:RNA-binding protein YlmH
MVGQQVLVLFIGVRISTSELCAGVPAEIRISFNNSNMEKTTTKNEISYPMRINRYLALHKYSSRREADELITKGVVTINGKKAKLGDKVNEKDVVTVNMKVQGAAKK